MRDGQQLVVLESMKMEHVVGATAAGVVASIAVAVGDTVHARRRAGRRRRRAESRPTPTATRRATDAVDLDARAGRPRRGARAARRRPRPPAPGRGRAAATPRASARRGRTSPTSSTTGTFVEYGPLVVAAQRRRRSLEELIARTPADGLVGGDRHGRRATPVDRDVVRLHGPRRHPGRAGTTARRTGCSSWPSGMRAADRVLHRGRRRPARRHRRLRRRRPRLPRLPRLRAAAAGSCRWSASTSGYCFAGQRRAPRLLRRDHRHRRLEHRHGRPGDDRGRRPRRVRADRRSGR